MKAEIIKENNLGNNNFLIEVQLIPENIIDANSIKNVEAGIADENELQTVNGFINLSLSQKNYSPITFVSQQGEIFTIEAFKN